ncbi:unnamed protein product, partial [Mesorhabditis belari]|uniref:Laminin G domain-containing protein n=1 Tax=Mesorhabditis belari TaxID=2138241 RepID=A0AAF3FQT5_9BILA
MSLFRHRDCLSTIEKNHERIGSLSPSKISGGRALDDGEWHEMRWVHQFDSVQLSIDGVLQNQTTPTGLYRKTRFAFTAISAADGGWHGLSLRIRGSRLEVDIDGFNCTVVGGMGGASNSVHLFLTGDRLPGCYHPMILDFATVRTEGKVAGMTSVQ